MGEVWNDPNITDAIIQIVDERIDRVASEAVRSYLKDAFLTIPVLYDDSPGPLTIKLWIEYPLDEIVEVSASLQKILRDEISGNYPRTDDERPKARMLRALLRILEEQEGIVDWDERLHGPR